ncbi:MAG: hypothetical protein QOG69_1715 [Actinomycetota bacterium]|nr:hypothetical protein [Actinomycetota bacterium]
MVEVRAHVGRTPPIRRRAIALALAASALWPAAGCSASSNDLDRIARGVPLPAGLTFVREDRFTNGGIGGTKQVNLVYTEPPGGCDKLRADWTAALSKAHRHFSIVGTARVRFLLPNSVADLAIDLDWDGTQHCEQAAINAEAK